MMCSITLSDRRRTPCVLAVQPAGRHQRHGRRHTSAAHTARTGGNPATKRTNGQVIKGVESVAHYSEVGGGQGGYNQDHEFFGYHQSL